MITSMPSGGWAGQRHWEDAIRLGKQQKTLQAPRAVRAIQIGQNRIAFLREY